MPLLVQGFDNCQREGFGIKMWLVGCVPPIVLRFCCLLLSCHLWHCSQSLVRRLLLLDAPESGSSNRWEKLPQQASTYWRRRILNFFGQLCCLLWMKSVDFDIWLLQPLSAGEFLCYTATGCPCALRCCRVRAPQILWGIRTTSVLYAFFPFIFWLSVWAERALVFEYKKIIMRMVELWTQF